MNSLTIIGNICNEVELRTTQSGINVCSFTVAVNRRKTQNNQNPEADYFRVSAWRGLADICSKFLKKGSKVCVVGPVSVSTNESKGKTYANLNVTADTVEFIDTKGTRIDKQSGMEVVETDDLPY